MTGDPFTDPLVSTVQKVLLNESADSKVPKEIQQAYTKVEVEKHVFDICDGIIKGNGTKKGYTAFGEFDSPREIASYIRIEGANVIGWVEIETLMKATKKWKDKRKAELKKLRDERNSAK